MPPERIDIATRPVVLNATDPALAPLIDWTSQMAGFRQSRFDDLEELLKRMDQ